MAKKSTITSDVNMFFNRLRGQDTLRKSNSLTILDTPQTEKERLTKQKIQSVVNFVKTKTWQRRHVEYFEEYRRMVNTFPIIKAAIDIYGEEVTVKNTDGFVFSIKSDDKKLKEELEQLFFKTLNMNTLAYKIVRHMCQFGNVYGNLRARPKEGVTDIIFLPPEAIIRDHMYDPSNIDNYRFVWYGAGGGSIFEPWEIVHWRNSEDIEMEPYGTSILRSVLDTWRRVVLIREALVVYRITRAPSKLLFKIDTTGLTAEEANRFAQEMKKEITKKPLVNPQTGEIDFKYNPISIDENYFIPVQEGSPSDIQVLEGASNLDAIEDYKIIKDDLFAGLKIPKSFLTFEEDLSNKAALSEEDIRFAKTTQRIQSEFVEGILHIALVHLFLKGYSKADLQNFEIEMNNPSVASEKRKLELVEQRINIAKAAWDPNNPSLNLISYVDVLKTVLKFSDEEIEQTIRAQFAEKKIAWRLQQLYNNGIYEEPEIEKKLAELKGLGIENNEMPTGFEGLSFSASTFTETVKKKIDEEIKEILTPVKASVTKKHINTLLESSGSLIQNLHQAKKDFGLE